MKKVLSLLLVLSIAIGLFGVTASAAGETTVTAEAAMAKLQKLDADIDGTISTADAAQYLKAAAGILPSSDID